MPITAVVRINGLYFCYVAEGTEQGLVARQRPIEVGEWVGSDWTVTGVLSVRAAMTLYSLWPHMHYRGSQAKYDVGCVTRRRRSV